MAVKLRKKDGKLLLTCVGCSRESEVSPEVADGRETFKCPNLKCSYVGAVDWIAKAAEEGTAPAAPSP